MEATLKHPNNTPKWIGRQEEIESKGEKWYIRTKIQFERLLVKNFHGSTEV